MEQAINMAELLGDLDFDPVALKAKYLQERDKRIREDGNGNMSRSRRILSLY